MDIKIRHIINSNKNLKESLLIPSSKSHTIRALLFASMAKGESRLENPLNSADVESCANACKILGAKISVRKDYWLVQGMGGNFTSKEKLIDVGNSGTTLYLASGLASLSAYKTTFTGDKQIKSRPVLPLLNSLQELGATISPGNCGSVPFSISGPIKGGETSIECLSSQYLSSLLMAAPLAKSDTIINVPILMERPYVEMTLGWLDELGIRYSNESFSRFIIYGGQSYKAFNKLIPADYSSAAFPLCAAAITGLRLTLKGLDKNDNQGDKAIVDYLKAMDCEFETTGTSLTMTAPGHKECSANMLAAGDFDLNNTPDALPAMAVAACFAKGTTRLYNVPQARLKETDRISVMRKELSKLGANVEELSDGLVIYGGNPLRGCRLNGHGDHRVVMALSVAALRSEGETIISDSEAVGITYPGFFKMMQQLFPSCQIKD